MRRVSAVILAGGASRRLPGSDKLSAEVGGAKLIERVHGVLRGFCPEIFVVGSGGSDANLPNTKLSKTRRIPDSRPGGHGPLAGLEAGLRAASNETVLAAAGDMPFLSRELAAHLCRLVEDEELSAAVPMHEGRIHPLFAAYRAGVAGEITAALDGDIRSMKSFLASLERVEYIEGLDRFGDPDILLMNVNSPEDLERARGMV